jgi:hypothetical protein
MHRKCIGTLRTMQEYRNNLQLRLVPCHPFILQFPLAFLPFTFVRTRERVLDL